MKNIEKPKRQALPLSRKNSLTLKLRKMSTYRIAEDICKWNAQNMDKMSRDMSRLRSIFKSLIEEFLIREDYADHLGFIRDSLLENGVRHPDVLHFYIRAYLGFDIPRKKVCKDHCAPFTFVSEMFFEQVRNSIAFVNRTGGKTLNIAILNHIDMMFKPRCSICSAGATLEQSSRMYKYFTNFHNDNQYLTEQLFKDPTKGETVYVNGANIQIITGSMKGFNGPHPQKARIDEVELMDWSVLQQALSMAQSKDNIMAQNCFSCITADTLIDVVRNDEELLEYPDGVPLFELMTRLSKGEVIKVKCFDYKSFQFTESTINAIWKTKTDRVYRLHYEIFTSDGNIAKNSLTLTNDHRVYKCDGSYVEAKDLEKGDVLLSSDKDVLLVFQSLEFDSIQTVYDMEVEKHHNFVANGIVLRNSTRKEEFGTMQRLLDKAMNDKRVRGGFKIYKWCIWEILEQCTRDCRNDKVYGLCPVLDICKGKAKKCSGFYSVDDFIDKAVTLDRETLDTEWFNKKPSSEVYVYGRWFDEMKHVLPKYKTKDLTWEQWLLKHCEIEKMAAIDFGSSPGHPFVYKLYFCDVGTFKKEVENCEPDDIIRSKITFYCVYEYRSGEATIATHADNIKNSPYFSKEIPIFADPSARQERIDLESMGVYTYEANNEVVAGIDTVRAHLQIVQNRAHFYHIEGYYDCKEELESSTEEYKKYRYRRTKEGKVNRKEPLPMHDHGPDCDRYAINTGTAYFRETFRYFEDDISGGYWGRKI